MDEVDVLIIGAGVAGLSCARTLVDAGRSVRVLERSAAVGGRCASKPVRPGGRLVDFGPTFVHGDDSQFLEWMESFGGERIAGWPRVVEGAGTPCQPQAFDPHQRRWALRAGLRRLPEALAAGLDVVTHATVETLGWTDRRVEAVTANGVFTARHGVLAAALEQTQALLVTLPGDGGQAARGARAVLALLASLPCLAVLAEFAPGTTPPRWDLWYPEASALLMVSNETSKREPGPGGPLLLLQARPGWSADRLGGDRDQWSTALLNEAATTLGDWVRHPAAMLTHRWKYARLGAVDHLVQPLLLERSGSEAQWGLTGDAFDPDGGLQGAWRAGRRLGERLLQALS